MRGLSKQDNFSANPALHYPKYADLAPSFLFVLRSFVATLFKPALLLVVLGSSFITAQSLFSATLTGRNEERKIAALEAELQHQQDKAVQETLAAGGEVIPVGEAENSFFDSADLIGNPEEVLAELTEKPQLLNTSVTAKTQLSPQLPRAMKKVETARLDRYEVNFIAGLIAAHRPDISDTGHLSERIVKTSLDQGMDPFLTAAIISIESRFHEKARSHKGATGLMQLMPGTARDVVQSLAQGPVFIGLTDSQTNILLGIRYYKMLEKKYSGNHYLALAAYNWGFANVDRVKGKPSSIPKSVRSYAMNIMERATKWRRHYEHTQDRYSNHDNGVLANMVEGFFSVF